METLDGSVLNFMAAATVKVQLPEVVPPTAANDGDLVLCFECNRHVPKKKSQKQGTPKMPKFKCRPCKAMAAKINAAKANNGNMKDTLLH
eukprot:3875846-Heterocapsa_arctica.AAC.1